MNSSKDSGTTNDMNITNMCFRDGGRTASVVAINLELGHLSVVSVTLL